MKCSKLRLLGFNKALAPSQLIDLNDSKYESISFNENNITRSILFCSSTNFILS